MRARVTRFTAVSQAFLLMLTLVLPGLVAATEITTDLWVYQNGDLVTVTGIDFGANETVDVVSTDPVGAMVDHGLAETNEAGGFTYAFILNVTEAGIYDVIATGQTSGLTATTQFDPPNTPVNLKFVDSRATDNKVTLSWTSGGSGSNGADCYRVFRSSAAMPAKLAAAGQTNCSSAADGNFIAQVGSSTVSYADTPGAGTWFYYVTALRTGSPNAGESPSSNQVTTRDMEGSLPSSFGSIGVGSSSSGSTFTVTNNSGGTIIVRAPSKSGTNQGDFAISGLTPAAGSNVANGGSFSFTVTFTPGAVGARSANIEVNVSDAGTPTATNTRVAPVSGTGADTTAPTVTAFSCVPAAGTTNDTSLDCSVTFSESVTGFVANSADLLITGTSTGWSAGTTTGSGAGPYTFTVSRSGSVDGSLGLQIAAGAAQDAASNPSTASSSLSYTIDTAAPSVTAFTCTPAPGTINNTSLSCSVTFSETVTGFVANSADLTIGGSSTTWTAGATGGSGAGPYTFTVTRGAPGNSSGTLTLQVAAGAATDGANGTSASSTLSYGIDTTVPNTPVISAPPANPTNSQSASFTFSTPADPTVNGVSSGINRLECQLDGGGFSTCTSPATYAGLGAGSHTFQVRAVDNAGNTGAAASSTWVIDLTAPTVTAFSCTPVGPSINVTLLNCSATFSESVTGFNPTTTDLTVGGASTAWTAGSAAGSGAGPYTFTMSRGAPNSDGTLTLQIAAGAAADAAGNGSAASSVVTRTVDTTRPTASLSCTPLGVPTNATTIACILMFDEAVTGFDPQTADLIIGGTSPSSDDWDPSIGTGSGTGPYNFTVVRTAPNKDGNLTFQISAGAAQDSLGNLSLASNTLTYLIDTTEPTVAITSTPTNPTTSTSASFGFTATDPTNGSANGVSSGVASTQCQLDGSGFASCSSPASYSSLGLGSHTFQVRAIDNGGNVGAPASFTWTIVAPDAAPTVVSTNPANGATDIALTGANIAITFSEPVNVVLITVSCASSSTHTYGKTGDGTSTVTFTLAGGEHYNSGELCTVTLTAALVTDVDTNDPPNAMAADYVFQFTAHVNNTAPVLTVPASPVIAEATSPSSAVVTFSVTATDAEDNPDPTPTCNHNSGDAFPIGDTTVNCSVTDSGGMSDSDSFTVRVRDTTDPTVDITTAEFPNGFGWFNIASNDLVAGVTVDVATADAVGVTSLTCTDNAVSVGTLDATGDSFVLGDGEHFIQCTATDGAGNDASDSAAFSVDQTAPSIDIDHTADGSNGWNVTDPVTEAIVASDATSGVDSVACLDGVDPLPVTFDDPDWSASVTGDGIHDLSCTATDVAGNTDTDTDQVKIDTVDPTIDISHVADGDNDWNVTNPVTESIATTGGATSVACLEDSSPLATTGASPTWSASVSGQGVHALSCTATDAAGNTSAADTDTVKIDTVAPTFTHTLTPASPAVTGWYNIATGAPVMAFTCSDGTSGLASACPGNFTFGNGASQSHSETIYDNAGNSSSQSESGISVDLIAPSISAALSPAADVVTGWWNIATGAPTVTYTCGDTGSSGLASCTAPHLFGEGADQTHSGTATDVAGNSNTAGVSNVDVDLTAPSISSAVTPARPASGWWNIASGAPTVTYTCGDTGSSGLASCKAGHASLTNAYTFLEGENQVDTGTAKDVAGNINTATVTNIDVDLTAPAVVVAVSAGTAGAHGWYTSNVTVDTSGTDLTSGVSDANCTADATQTTDTTGTNFSGQCTDNAGNVGSGGPLLVKVDKVNPSVAITSPATGYITVASSINVSGTDSDATSGIDTVKVNGYTAGLGTNTFSYLVLPLSCGVNTITAVATDMAGRTDSSSITVTPVCSAGLQYYSPIDQSVAATPVINTGKMGRVIPVKITASINLGSGAVNLTDTVAAANGLSIKIGVNKTDCANTAQTDDVEAYADAGSANGNTPLFRWTSPQWIYNLDTGKAPSVTMAVNSCYRLDVYLLDSHGTQILLSTGPGTGVPYAIFKPTK